jgi:hypothetical protein
VLNLPVHISVRLAWHDNGWNGRICENPRENTFCVGPHSYPGDLIATDRKLLIEEEFKGKNCLEMFSNRGEIPPCCYSINAFGRDQIQVKSKPPEFFNDGTPEKIWSMPPYSVSTWPYEEMYKDEIKNPDGTYNNDRRREEANKFFEALEPKKTLIFYYANYSNPFSENEQNNYPIIGVSRLAKPADEELLYNGCSEETKTKFAEGLLWQRVLVSSYPEEGFRIPYHLYRDKPEILERIGLIPENPRNFKYATRHIRDDEALTIIERFIEVAGTLLEIGDKTENWSAQIDWLNSLVAELWQGRGKYPGMLRVLDCLGFKEAIRFYKNRIMQDQNQECVLKNELFALIKGEKEKISDLDIDEKRKAIIRRQWMLKDDDQKSLLEDVLPRFDLTKEQMMRILDDEREQHGLFSPIDEIVKNPYILSEEYVGDGPDDFISFNKIDHGILLSPDLGESDYSDFCKDDARRLRALCVEQLRNESQHTFLQGKQVINRINHKLSYLPEWKRHSFNVKYLNVDRETLEKALFFRPEKKEIYLYLKSNYEYEREIERQIKKLAEISNEVLCNKKRRKKRTIQHPHVNEDRVSFLLSS